MIQPSLKNSFVILVCLFLLSCSKQENKDTTSGTVNKTGGWLVPFEDILYWGDPPDEIKSIDDPVFIPVSESGWSSGDRMLVAHYKGLVRVYPVTILESHEIVNDRIEELFLAVTYCPITGSGIAWDRTIEGEVTGFGVSGMLFRENLIPYDRQTGSFWSQMRMTGIHGPRIEIKPLAVTLIETDFSLVDAFFPEAMILSDSCSGAGNCRYKDATDDVEPGYSNQGLLDPGKQYFGLMDDTRALVFSIDSFWENTTLYIVSFSGNKILVAGNNELDFITAFDLTGFGQITFQPLHNQFPNIFKDDSGNVYNIFGVIVSGPQKGKNLTSSPAYRAKGFAWESLFTALELFEDQ